MQKSKILLKFLAKHPDVPKEVLESTATATPYIVIVGYGDIGSGGKVYKPDYF